jgi:hypothetical protein
MLARLQLMLGLERGLVVGGEVDLPEGGALVLAPSAGAGAGIWACLRARLGAHRPLALLVPKRAWLLRRFVGRHVSLIDATAGLDTVMAVKAALARGALVITLADRVADEARPLRASTPGGEVAVAAAPFVLAAVLKCPVLFAAARSQAGRWQLELAPLFAKLILPPGDREAALVAAAQAFAERAYAQRLAARPAPAGNEPHRHPRVI